MNIQEARIITQKLVDGTASAEEKAALLAFISSYSDKDTLLDGLLPMQELTGPEERPLPAGMEARVLNNILERGAGTKMTDARIGHSRIRRIVRIGASIAAILALCIITYWLLDGRRHQPTPATPHYLSIVTQPGSRKSITLADGSHILLNGGSSLRFPETMEGGSREVYLDGEAFFDVSKDSLRPFIIHSPTLSTTVLGTSFNMKASGQDPFSEVSVATGKVKVEGSGRTAGRSVYVAAGQRATYRSDVPGSLDRSAVDIASIGAWKDHRFYYDQTSLGTILSDLQRAYGLQFRVKDPVVLKCRFSASFTNLSAEGILQTLHLMSHIQFTHVLLKKDNTLIEVSGTACQ